MTFAESVRRIVAALASPAAIAIIARATSARAEYVFGRLKAIGETRQTIEQCCCSIDLVASLVPYRFQTGRKYAQ